MISCTILIVFTFTREFTFKILSFGHKTTAKQYLESIMHLDDQHRASHYMQIVGSYLKQNFQS
jgi:hypothetical protein